MKLRTKLSALVLAGCMAASLVPAACAAGDGDSLANYDESVLTKSISYSSSGSAVSITYSYNSHGDLVSETPSTLATSEGGWEKYSYEYVYDALGNQTNKKESINDILVEETRNEYNGRDLATSYTGTGNDENWRKAEYSYTETEVKKTLYDVNGNLVSTIVIAFDDSGNILSSTTMDTSGTILNQDTYAYNDNGDRTKENYYQLVNGQKRTDEHTYTYNEAGLKTKHDCVSKLDGADLPKSSFSNAIDYKTDDNGTITSITVTKNGKLTDRYDLSYNKDSLDAVRYYDENGKLTSLENYDADGNKIAIYGSFDENGNPIKDKNCIIYEYTKLSDLLKDTVKDSFNDVKTDEYYATPILWAVNNGITNGMGNSTFEPNTNCTRGQIVTFLWRMAGQPEPTSANNPFTDVDVNAYYGKAVLWAVENGITKGMTDTTFEPNRTCTRGQTVTFIWRADGEPNAETSTSFTDVNTGAYYGSAVLWAVENEVTNGMGNNKFEPETTCTRGHIVTFLYRAFAE